MMEIITDKVALRTPTRHTFPEDLPSMVGRLMGEVMKKYQALGLASNQLGYSFGIVAIDNSPGTSIVMVNPRILSQKGTQREWEGCLSLPGIRAKLDRPTEVTVAYQTRFMVEQKRKFTGLQAAVVAHEIDHLHGILMIDHVDAEIWGQNF